MAKTRFRCPNGHISIENIICDYCKEMGTPVEEKQPVKEAQEAPKEKKKAE